MLGAVDRMCLRDLGIRKMKEIPLTQGKVALVDDDDYEYLSQFKWCAVRLGGKKDLSGAHWYAVRGRLKSERKQGEKGGVMMHNVILPPRGKLITCHISRSGLDNRKANLFRATRTELALRDRRRRKSFSDNSKFVDGKGRFYACIGFKGTWVSLGGFNSCEEASAAYEAARAEFLVQLRVEVDGLMGGAVDERARLSGSNANAYLGED